MKKPKAHKQPKPAKPQTPQQQHHQLQKQRQAKIRSLRHQLHQAQTAPLKAPKPAKAPAKKQPRALSGGVPCVAAAVAAALGLPDAVPLLPFCPDEALIEDVLERAAEVLPVTFWPVNPADATAGTVLGLALPEGPHAAVYAGGGLMWSWGRLMPVYGDAEEAWAVTWA